MILEAKEINQIKKALKPEFSRLENEFQTSIKELREFINRSFQDLTMVLNQTFATKEDLANLEQRVENLEESTDEIRKLSGFTLRDKNNKNTKNKNSF